MMEQILLVDDEKWIRLGVQKRLRALFGERFCVRAAGSAAEALALLEGAGCDILITDIRMPGMDGIELVRRARELCPDVQAVVISGYADFSYAEQALNMGVKSYLLKPIRDDRLREAVEKASAAVCSARQSRLLAGEAVRAQADRGRMVAERQLNRLLHAEAPLVPEAEAAALFPAPLFCMLITVHIDFTAYNRGEPPAFAYQDAALIRYGIRNIACECAQPSHFARFMALDNLQNENEVFLLLSHAERPALEEAAGRYLLKCCEAVLGSLRICATFALSGAARGVVPLLRRQAQEGIELRLLHGTDKCYRYSDITPAGAATYPAEKMALLQESIERREPESCRLLLKSLFEAQNFQSPAQAKVLYFDVVNTLIKVCWRQGLPTGRLIDSGVLGGEVFDSCASLGEVAAMLLSLIRKALAQEEFPPVGSADFNDRVLAAIDAHCAEALSLRGLADQFALSPNYFSNLFTKNNGIPFTQYLTRLRVEKACALLRDTSLPAERIAQSVGFGDARYFFRVFKRIVGKTPTEYRGEKT